MLQWMGGSRRKVTSSRKSIQNRQKQYFEQRKRQQQVPGLENLSDTQSKQAYCSEEPRSLDILSLTNLAAFTHQVYSGKTDEHDVSQKGSHFSQLSTENVVKKVTARYTEDFEKSCLQQGSSTQIKFSADQSFPESHGSSCKIDKFENQTAACGCTSINLVNKTSKQKEAPKNDLSEVSVIDLLGDDGLNSISDGGPVSEPHVAFSVEGLGKVGIGTPAHSPRLYERFLSPPKAPRRKQSLPKCMPSQYDFGAKMNVTMYDIMEQQDGSQLESRHNTRGLLDDECSNIKNKAFSFSCMSPVFGNNQNEKFNDEEESFYRVSTKEKPWSEAACGIVGNNFLFDEYGVEWMNEPVHTGSYPTFTPKANEYNSFDYDFRDAFSPMTRTSFQEHKGPDLQASSTQYLKDLTSEKEYSPASFDWGSKRSYIDSPFIPPSWPYVQMEDSQDNMSLLSEESCSTAAVRDKRSYSFGSHTEKLKHSKVMQKEQKKKHSRTKYAFDEFPPLEIYHTGLEEFLHELNTRGARKCNNMKNQKCTADSFSNNYTSFQQNIELKDITFFDPSTYHRTFKETDTRSFSHKCMSEDDLLDSFRLPEMFPDTKLSHAETNLKVPVGYEAPNNSIYENEILMQFPSPDIHLPNPFLWEADDHRINSSFVKDFNIDAEIPCLSKQQSSIFEDNHSFENNSSNGQTKVVANSINVCSDTAELKDGSQVDGPPTRDPSAEAEEAPRAMEEDSELESSTQDRQNEFDSQAPVPSQVATKEQGSTDSEIKNVGKGGGKEGASYQVMLESYVFQLLCVQKVLLAASEKDVKRQEHLTSTET